MNMVRQLHVKYIWRYGQNRCLPRFFFVFVAAVGTINTEDFKALSACSKFLSILPYLMRIPMLAICGVRNASAGLAVAVALRHLSGQRTTMQKLYKLLAHNLWRAA